MPPVWALTVSTAAVMLDWTVTSRARMVTLGRLARLGILDGVRAVAKTCRPRS